VLSEEVAPKSVETIQKAGRAQVSGTRPLRLIQPFLADCHRKTADLSITEGSPMKTTRIGPDHAAKCLFATAQFRPRARARPWARPPLPCMFPFAR
jgi:hypothetical protein